MPSKKATFSVGDMTQTPEVKLINYCEIDEDLNEYPVVMDKEFIYKMTSKGLMKIHNGVSGFPGKIEIANEEVTLSKATLMLLNSKLYVRHDSYKPAPFKVFDCSTLKQENTDDVKYEPKDGFSLQWTELDENTGRKLE